MKGFLSGFLVGLCISLSDSRGILRHVNTNQCVTTIDMYAQNNGNLKVVECDLNDYLQQWNVEYFKAEEVIPGPIFHALTNKALTVFGGSTDSGATVNLYDAWGYDNQRWAFVQNPYWEKIYQIQNVKSQMCLSYVNRKFIQQKCDDMENVMVSLQEFTYSYYPFSWNGGLIKSVPYGKSITSAAVFGGALTTSDIRPLIEAAPPASIWNVQDFQYVISIGSAGYLYSSWDPDLVMGTQNAGTQNAVRVTVQAKTAGAKHQQWSVEPVYLNGGALREVYIKNNASGRCLTAERDGEYLDIYDCGHVKHQQWLFVPSETWQGKFSDSCFSDDDCLSSNCTYGNCQLGYLKTGCRDKDDCSSGWCDAGACRCATGGTICDNDQQCCSETCVQTKSGGVCSCVGTDFPCFAGFSCCSGLCGSDSFCKCKGAGLSCNKNGFPGHSVGVECCSGKCTDRGVCAKKQPGQTCTKPNECESDLCNDMPGYERTCMETSRLTLSCSSDAECETRLGKGASCDPEIGCCFKSKFPVKCRAANGNDQDANKTTDPEANSACCSQQCYPMGPPFWKRNPLKKSSYAAQCV